MENSPPQAPLRKILENVHPRTAFCRAKTPSMGEACLCPPKSPVEPCDPLRLIAKCGECAIKLPAAGAARQLSERARPPPAPRFGSTASRFYQHSSCSQTARVGRNEQPHDVRILRTTAVALEHSRKLLSAVPCQHTFSAIMHRCAAHDRGGCVPHVVL